MTGTLAHTRRRFLFGFAATYGGAVLIHSSADEKKDKKEEEEVSPAEDLMREHGVLRRVLLVYREAIRRIEARQELPPEPIARAARLIRSFIEDYHERLEEEQLFPRFKKSNTLVPLVDTLYQQHQQGRILTATTLKYATAASLKNPADLSRLKEALSLFVRMYEPHAAREDTVLFPAFRKVVPPREYEKMGDKFEEREHALFGADGFEKNVEEIAGLEKALGVYELAQFTPHGM